jgi:hypothetical protein
MSDRILVPELTPGVQDHTPPSSLARKIFLRTYPYVSLGFGVWLLYWDLLYAFDRTRYQRPWYRFAGFEMVRDDGSLEVSLLRA